MRVLVSLLLTFSLFACVSGGERTSFITFGQAYDVLVSASIAEALRCERNVMSADDLDDCKSDLLNRDEMFDEARIMAIYYKDVVLDPSVASGTAEEKAVALMRRLRALLIDHITDEDQEALAYL